MLMIRSFNIGFRTGSLGLGRIASPASLIGVMMPRMMPQMACESMRRGRQSAFVGCDDHMTCGHVVAIGLMVVVHGNPSHPRLTLLSLLSPRPGRRRCRGSGERSTLELSKARHVGIVHAHSTASSSDSLLSFLM